MYMSSVFLSVINLLSRQKPWTGGDRITAFKKAVKLWLSNDKIQSDQSRMPAYHPNDSNKALSHGNKGACYLPISVNLQNKASQF